MEREQIEQSLNKKFKETLEPGEKRKIVFWYDSEQQFADLIDELELEQAKVHRLTERNYFYTKYLLEVEDTESNYIIYADHRPARDEDNWLIDTFLYSYEFYADRLLIQMEDLGIPLTLKPTVKHHEKFFKSAERRKKLASYKEWGYSPSGDQRKDASYDEATLEIAMMSVLCGLKYADQKEVYKKVLGSNIAEENKFLSEMNRFMDEHVFWKYAGRYFNYKGEKSLQKLAMHILINSLRRTLDDEYLQPFTEYLVEQGKGNCIYFVDQWMKDQTDNHSFNALSTYIDRSMGIAERIEDVSVEEMSECDSFEFFDQRVIRYIQECVNEQLENYEFCLQLIEKRRTKHWYPEYANIYEALYHLIKLLQIKKKLIKIPMLGAKEIWERYAQHYYRVDYHYRNFYWQYDQKPVEVLKPMRDLVENVYSNWFLEELGLAWSNVIGSDPGKGWRVEGVIRQQDFYQRKLHPIIKAGDRCFVIISDALRYEAAEDIALRLNKETAGTVDLETMLGVLPSTTPFGMAALLPHHELSLDEDGHILADGRKTDSLEERQQVLQKMVPEAIAIKDRTLSEMDKEARRELVKGKKLIYIYHDSIDATGHTAATEVKVFDAVQQSLEDIYRLVRLIRDELGGVNVFITADHGFLYRRDSLPESNKIKKETVSAFEEKRRYMLSYQEVQSEALMMFKPDYIHSAKGPLCIYVPRSVIRFKVQGPGLNFVHGGAMLQEVMVPLIKYKALRGSNKKKKEENKVKLKLVNESRKISNNIFNLEFFQTEKVDGEHLPRAVEIYIVDDSGKILSNREKLFADKSSDQPAERSFKARMNLKNDKYDKHKDYFLIIKDLDSEFVEEKIPFKIDIAFSSDFEF